MADKNGVLVFVEQDAGQPADVSLELVCKGRELADQLSVDLGAVVLGHGILTITDTLIAHGCD